MTGAFRFVRHESAQGFLDRAGVWLMLREAEHNLVLAIASGFAGAGPFQEEEEEGGSAPLFATVETGDEVVGCVIRTPPFKPILTRMPEAAVGAVAEGLGEVYPTLPAVMGPPDVARVFADEWVERVGGEHVLGDEMGIFELTEVIPPSNPPPGAMRLASIYEGPLVAEWIQAFVSETHLPSGDPVAMSERFLAEGRAFFWEDLRPTSLAVISGQTPSGVRIGYVYTPASERGRGFASALTAALSQHCLDTGSRACFLYTDLRNPTSNRIYQAIGYRPMGEAADFEFKPKDES